MMPQFHSNVNRARWLLLLWLSALGSIHSEVLYTAESLGMDHQAADLNDHGEVAGEYRGTIQRGIYFDGSDWIPTGLAGSHYDWSTLYAINNNHLAVGLNTTQPQVEPVLAVHAVSIHRDNALSPLNLGSLTGENGDAKARGINNLNVAVGDSLTATGKRHAVRFETNGLVTDLASMIGGESSSAIDINDRGDIVGEFQNTSWQTRGFLLLADGTMRDLGTLGGAETFVKRINARGEVAGSSMTATGEMQAFLYADGEMKNLGTLGGSTSAAYGLNDQGIVVGAAMKANGVMTPFIKHPGEPMIDLATQSRVPFPDVLVSAVAINNHGVIIVRGFYNAANYLLRPGALAIEIQDDGLHLKFAAPQNTHVRIDSSQTLTFWTPILTNTVTAEPIHFESSPTATPTFFRAIVLPTP